MILRRVSPSAIAVPISDVRSITLIIIVLKMLKTMITAIMTLMTATCFGEEGHRLDVEIGELDPFGEYDVLVRKALPQCPQRRTGLVGVFQQQRPDLRSIDFQQLLGYFERHPQGNVVVSFRHRGKEAPDPTFDRIDPASCRVRDEDHRIADVDAQVRGEAQAQDDSVGVIRRQVGTLGDAQRTAQDMLLVRLDSLGDKGDGFFALAHQPAERQASAENAHLWESFDGFQLGRTIRQEVPEGVGRSFGEISLTGDLYMPVLGGDGRFPMLEQDPVDESIRDNQCRHPERDRRESECGPPSLSRDVASGQEDIGQQPVPRKILANGQRTSSMLPWERPHARIGQGSPLQLLPGGQRPAWAPRQFACPGERQW